MLMQRRIVTFFGLTLLTLATAAAGFADDLGQRELAGVRALARLDAAGQGHRLQLAFRATDGDRPLTRGLVAVKLMRPDGQLTEAQKLELVDSRFVGDLTLSVRGEYTLLVACRLHDGRKRQFTFRYQRP